MTLFWTAFTIGFLGSVHCVGMCGPLALAAGGGKARSGLWLYHLGRLTTYSVLGALVGWIGRGLYLVGWQQTLSLGLGVVLLVAASLSFLNKRVLNRSSPMQLLFTHIKGHFAQFMGRKDHFSRFMVGVLNGTLPCGLVYLGLAGALAGGHWLAGAGVMVMFGLGTVPALLLLTLGHRALPTSVQRVFQRATPFVVAFMGLLLIIRGAGWGIPYLSPVLEWGTAGITSCG